MECACHISLDTCFEQCKFVHQMGNVLTNDFICFFTITKSARFVEGSSSFPFVELVSRFPRIFVSNLILFLTETRMEEKLSKKEK